MAPDMEKVARELSGLKLRIYDIPRDACVTRCGLTKQTVCERMLENAQKDEKAGKPATTQLCPFGWWNVDNPQAALCLCPMPEFPAVTGETLLREYYMHHTKSCPNNFIVAVVSCSKCKQELHLAQVISDAELKEIETALKAVQEEKKKKPAPPVEAKDVLP